MNEQNTSGYSDKEANRMKILSTLKAKKEKENREFQQRQALIEKQKQEEFAKEEAIKALEIKKEKRKKIIKKVSVSTIALFVFSIILFLPKVNEIKYQSLEGISTAFYVNSDLLGFYDTQIINNTVYDSAHIDEDSSKISFCSTKYKNVECFDTLLIEKKGVILSFPHYVSYLKDNFSFI